MKPLIKKILKKIIVKQDNFTIFKIDSSPVI